MMWLRRVLALAALGVGCSSAQARSSPPPLDAAPPVAAAPSVSVAASEPLGPATSRYPWRAGAAPAGDERLDGRFAAPPGFVRAPVAEGSFGAFLRSLPLAARGAPVVDFAGRPLHDGGRHPNIAAVADLDVGGQDLQHCADVILRLHAEWRYGRGDRELAYHTAAGHLLGYRRWLAGERPVVHGRLLALEPRATPRRDDHGALRAWLDDVFRWAGTASLAHEGVAVPPADLAPGDFFVMPGSPYGHAVLVLDVTRDARGRVALLLGQSYMPAQSFQILAPGPGSPWFVLEPDAAAVTTPFWTPFPLATSLRRFG